MGHSIVFFEIPADDVARAKAFYSELFGWQFQPAPGPGDYWTFGTGVEEGVSGGGMMARQSPEHVITNYINVESIEDSLAQVQNLGGSVMMPKQAVPQMGWMAWCQDTEGNAFALWQDDPSAA